MNWYSQAWHDIIQERGVENVCRDCNGMGVKVYPNSATWLGGAGGMAVTRDVCNKCWGSGDRDRPWPSHRKLQVNDP